MTATTKMPGHLRQQVPGENSNPNPQEGEAVMSRLLYESKSAEIVANIAQVMKARGMDDTALAEAADIEKHHLLNMLSMRESIDVENFLDIAAALRVGPEDLLDGVRASTVVPPVWARTSKTFHEDPDIAAEHFGPTVGVPAGGARIGVSQLVMKDGTVEPPMVGVEQDGERDFEFPLDLVPAFIDALNNLLDLLDEEAGK